MRPSRFSTSRAPTSVLELQRHGAAQPQRRRTQPPAAIIHGLHHRRRLSKETRKPHDPVRFGRIKPAYRLPAVQRGLGDPQHGHQFLHWYPEILLNVVQFSEWKPRLEGPDQRSHRDPRSSFPGIAADDPIPGVSLSAPRNSAWRIRLSPLLLHAESASAHRRRFPSQCFSVRDGQRESRTTTQSIDPAMDLHTLDLVEADGTKASITQPHFHFPR